MQLAKFSPFNLLARAGPYLVLAACLAVAVLFALLGQYAHPSSDDFCMAAGVERFGLLAQLWQHYFEWSGRYSGNAFYAIYPLILGLFDGYGYIAVFMITLLFVAAAFFLSMLFQISIFSRLVLLSSVGFVSVYLLGLISPASSLYWMAGALSYQTANVLLLIILGLMIHVARLQQLSRAYRLPLAMLLVVIGIAMGANETSMLAITALAFVAFAVRLRSGWPILKPWLIVLLTALICFAVVYLSPGNAVRAADFPLRHGFMRAVNGSVFTGLQALWIWFSNPVLITGSLLAAVALFRLNHLAARPLQVTNAWIVLLLLCTLLLPIVLQLPAWWAMGGWPPPRTLDAIYFLFLLSWFATVGAIALRLSGTATSGPRKRPKPGFAAFAVTLVALGFTWAVLASPALQRVKHDLFQAASPWSGYMHQRYRQIDQAVADGRLDLVVADYEQAYPVSLYFNDIMRKPWHWRNRCYADYFGLNTIRRAGSGAGLGRERDKAK